MTGRSIVFYNVSINRSKRRHHLVRNTKHPKRDGNKNASAFYALLLLGASHWRSLSILTNYFYLDIHREKHSGNSPSTIPRSLNRHFGHPFQGSPGMAGIQDPIHSIHLSAGFALVAFASLKATSILGDPT